METLDGSCHCGKVRVRAPGDAFGVVACHCVDCQRLHGNYFAMLVAERSAVRFDDEAEIAWYRSSPGVERGFCRTCGSRIAKRPEGGTKVMLSVGLFDRDLPVALKKNVWLEQKPAWYATPAAPEVP